MSKSDTPSQVANIHPAPGYLFIEPEEQQTKTSSGIYLPDNAKPDKPQKGTVLGAGDDLAVAEDVVRKSPAKKGDVVMYKKWGGNETKIDGKEYLFVKFEDILATIN